MVKNTIFKREFTVRYRQCLNKQCRYRFKTKEMLEDEWNYKIIVYRLKDMLRDIK